MPKAQATLEFMTTYGWAFLVVLGMAGALTYFGVFDFDRFVTDSCVITGELVCDDFALSPALAKMKIRNNFGKSVEITAVTCERDEDNTLSTNSFGTPFTLGPGETTNLNCFFPPDSLPPKEKDLVNVEITFNRVGSPTSHTITGEVLSTVNQADPPIICEDAHGVCCPGACVGGLTYAYACGAGTCCQTGCI